MGTVVVVSIVTIATMLTGLVRDGMRLVRTGMDSASALMPVIDEIGQAATEAQEKMASLQKRAAAIQAGRR